MYNNKFIVAFEGIDGCGKTTQCSMLIKSLSEGGFKNKYVKNPLSDVVKRILEEVAQKNKDKDIAFYEKYEWIVAIYETNKKRFTDILSDSDFEIIIFDRYIYTDRITLRRLDFDNNVHNVLVNWLPKPDIIFYLDIDADTALERINIRGRTHKPGAKYTREQLHEFVVDYQEEFNELSGVLHKFNSLESIESIHEEIKRTLENALILIGYATH